MHKRGYRTGAIHAGALRESTGAGLLLHAGYDPERHVLCDPMAGSGTLPIEAALIATQTAPGLLRQPPPISRRSWAGSDAVGWQALIDEASALRRTTAPMPILANDWHRGASELAQRAAEAAGVVGCIEFSEHSVIDYVPSQTPQLVVSNPPWDLRLAEGGESWQELGSFLKQQCGGATAWLLSGNKELTRHLRMRKSSSLRIEQAGTGLSFLRYDVLKPKGPEWAAVAPPPIAIERAASLTVPPRSSLLASEMHAAGQDVEAIGGASSHDALTWQQDLAGLKVAELKDLLRARGLPMSGVKAELVARLQEHSSVIAMTEAVQTAAVLKPLPSGEPRGPGAMASENVELNQVLTIVDGTGKEVSELDALFSSLYD